METIKRLNFYMRSRNKTVSEIAFELGLSEFYLRKTIASNILNESLNHKINNFLNGKPKATYFSSGGYLYSEKQVRYSKRQKCLMCDKEFNSKNKFNKICSRCKSTQEWAS